MNFAIALRNAILGVAAARRAETPESQTRLIDKPLPPFPADRMGERCLWCYVRIGTPHVLTPEGRTCPEADKSPEEGPTNDT